MALAVWLRTAPPTGLFLPIEPAAAATPMLAAMAATV